MTKPDSIRKFDMLYLGSLVLGLVSFIFDYSRTSAIAEAQMARDGAAGFGATALIAGIVIGTLLTLGLWFLVSQKRVGFVRWIIAAILVLNLLLLAFGFPASLTLADIVGLVSMGLQIVAVWFVFRPDAAKWFNRDNEPADPTLD